MLSGIGVGEGERTPVEDWNVRMGALAGTKMTPWLAWVCIGLGGGGWKGYAGTDGRGHGKDKE